MDRNCKNGWWQVSFSQPSDISFPHDSEHICYQYILEFDSRQRPEAASTLHPDSSSASWTESYFYNRMHCVHHEMLCKALLT